MHLKRKNYAHSRCSKVPSNGVAGTNRREFCRRNMPRMRWRTLRPRRSPIDVERVAAMTWWPRRNARGGCKSPPIAPGGGSSISSTTRRAQERRDRNRRGPAPPRFVALESEGTRPTVDRLSVQHKTESVSARAKTRHSNFTALAYTRGGTDALVSILSF